MVRTEIMKMRGLTFAFILTMLLLEIPTWANAQTSNPLFGTWRVISFKSQIVGEPGERDIFSQSQGLYYFNSRTPHHGVPRRRRPAPSRQPSRRSGDASVH